MNINVSEDGLKNAKNVYENINNDSIKESDLVDFILAYYVMHEINRLKDERDKIQAKKMVNEVIVSKCEENKAELNGDKEAAKRRIVVYEKDLNVINEKIESIDTQLL